jgi:dienelactone hydrolase
MRATLPARTEVVPFHSGTPDDAAFLTGSAGPAAIVAGVLRLARASGERQPLAVLLHGSGGVMTYVEAWAQRLLDWGWASFTLDSFSGRGLTSVREHQGALGRLVGVLDAYRALERLEQHPLIDPRRIVLMGFSRGGQAALYAALARFQRLHQRGHARYAAHLAFYPNCCTRYLDDEDLAPVPIRIHHGEADDLNPIAPCRDYATRLRAAGADVQLHAYPGAHHVFDGEQFAKAHHAPQALSMRDCRVAEVAPGQLMTCATGRPFDWNDASITRGATAAYHAEAAQAAIAAVAALLQRWHTPPDQAPG